MNQELSLVERIKRYFQQRATIWINGKDIEELTMQAGYKASNGSRRCRELAEEGYLDREERRGKRTKSVWYKWHDYL